MEVPELKFMLKLLEFPDYRASISQITPNSKTKAAERDSICRTLRDRDLVGCREEVVQLRIAPPGKALLKLDTSTLPVSQEELQVLKACADASVSPGQTGLQRQQRQPVVRDLVDRGLVKAEKTQIADVWLTQRGCEYLRDEYNPAGTTPVLSLDLLANYVRFLRKSLHESPSNGSATPTVLPTAVKPSDDDIFELVRELDRHLGTDNYLPIFHLRQKLQPPLTREELDRALYRLQRQDRIELSSLQEAMHYTPEQIEAGIGQDIGGPLFFIITL